MAVSNEEAPQRAGQSTLLINNQRIPLASGVDLDALRADIVTAMHTAGEFVTVAGHHGQSYDVLITPTTQVLMRHDSASIDDSGLNEPWRTTFELDY